MIIETWKAVAHGNAIEDLLIRAGREPYWIGLRANTVSLDAVRQKYADEAQRIVEAMLVHMPQGLTDAIFAELCRQKASLFVVPQGYRREGAPCDPPSE